VIHTRAVAVDYDPACTKPTWPKAKKEVNNVVKENDRLKRVITKLSNVGLNITKTKSRREILQSLKQYQPLPKTLTQDS